MFETQEHLTLHVLSKNTNRHMSFVLISRVRQAHGGDLNGRRPVHAETYQQAN